MDHLYSVYQPIYLLEREEIIGHEALLRGPSSPLELFQKAMEGNSLPQLDVLAMNMAIKSFRFDDSLLFINCHPLTFNQIDVSRSFREGYSRFCDQIVLEITEHEQLQHSSIIKQKIRDLKELGIKIALDDFGKGYTNLSLIELLEPDYIKIDRSIIKNIDSVKKIQSLVTGIVKLSNDIVATIIAEGIETEEQLKIIKDCGVNYGQGWHLGHPQKLCFDTDNLEIV